MYGFYDEIQKKYGNANPWKYFTDVFGTKYSSIIIPFSPHYPSRLPSNRGFNRKLDSLRARGPLSRNKDDRPDQADRAQPGNPTRGAFCGHDVE